MALAVDAETLWAFVQVIMIDLVLAGDNAVVIQGAEELMPYTPASLAFSAGW